MGCTILHPIVRPLGRVPYITGRWDYFVPLCLRMFYWYSLSVDVNPPIPGPYTKYGDLTMFYREKKLKFQIEITLDPDVLGGQPLMIYGVWPYS